MSEPTWNDAAQVHIVHEARAGAPRVGCLGGFCAAGLRDACAHYQRTDARHLSERLCIAGRADEFVRVGGARQAIPEGAA